MSFGIGVAQQMDYYEHLLKTNEDKTIQLTALDSLLSYTFRNDPQAFIEYSKLYIRLAREMDRIEDAARGAMNVQHPLTTIAGDPSAAISLINSVLRKKEKIKDSLLLGGLYMKRGRAYSKLNLQHAIDDYSEALENFAKNDTLHRADVYLFRGQAHSQRGQFVPAQQDFDLAYRLYEAKEEYTYMIYARQGITSMFSMNGFYDKAEKERRDLIEKMKELKMDSYLSGEYFNQALDYRKMNRREEELKNLLLAEKHLDKSKSNFYTSIGIHSLFVSYYCDHNMIEEAKKHLDYMESVTYEFKGNLPSELNYLSARIDYLMVIGEYNLALDLAESKLAMAQQLGFEDEIMASHETLAAIYYQKKRYDLSIDHSKTAATLKDSIYTRMAINSLAYYQTLYEIEKKEKDLIEKTTSIQLLQKDNQNVKAGTILGGIAIIFGFIMVITYRNQRELKNRRDLQDDYTQKLLNSQEAERKKISQNLHDGLGQQLLVLKNRLLSSNDHESLEMIDLAIEEIRGISRDLHPFPIQEMGITRAIENTLSLVDRNTKIFVSSEIDNIDDLFTKESELNIFRIIQESLSNIIKHSDAKATKVNVKKLQDFVFISIRDNGKGFVFSEKYRKSDSLGLKTLRERVRFLSGQMKVNSSKDSGTLLEFKIPYNK